MEERKISNFQRHKLEAGKKYIIKKYKKSARVKSKDVYVDDLLQDLETTVDQNGNVVDTRFNKEEQAFIRQYLKDKNVTYLDTGYLSLRNVCYNLNTKDRLELCKNINYKFDKGIDIDKRMKKSSNFFQTHKKGLAAIGGGLVLGTTGGLIMNYANPSVIPTAIGDYLNKSQILGASSGVVSGVISFLPPLPVNLVAGALTGIAAGALTSATMGIYGMIKNSKKRHETNRAYDGLMEVDKLKYKNDNVYEMLKYEEMMERQRRYPEASEVAAQRM